MCLLYQFNKYGLCMHSCVRACAHMRVYILVPCADLEFDPKPGPQLAVRGPAQARNNFSSPAQARKLEFRPRPEPDRECLAQARPASFRPRPGPYPRAKDG